MKARHIVILIVSVAAAAPCFAGPGPAVANARHAPHERIQFSSTTPRRDHHARQMDTNDLAGHGAWLGCAARHTSAGTKESTALTAVYCGRAPMFLARADGAAAAISGRSA
jgi:hypothetical protein